MNTLKKKTDYFNNIDIKNIATDNIKFWTVEKLFLQITKLKMIKW